MPTYQFCHKETGEVVEKIMKNSEREQFLKDNPVYSQVHLSTPAIGDPIRLGIKKPPSDFQKEIIGRVSRMPGAQINSKFGIPKEY